MTEFDPVDAEQEQEPDMTPPSPAPGRSGLA